MHEAAHRVVFGRIIRNAGAAQQIADRRLRADPDRENGLRRPAMPGAIFLHHPGHGCGDLVGARNRRLHVHDKHGVVFGVGQQRFQRCGIARGIGVADDIDRIRFRPCRRQRSVQLLADRRRKGRGNAAKVDQPVNRQHADAAAIGQDRKPLSGRRFEPPERFGTVEQFSKIRDPQDAGTLKRGVVDGIGPGQRAGMGCSRPRALRHPARLDDHDRLDSGGSARRRHELARILDRFDVEQDRVGLFIQREIIEQIGDIYIELVANGDNAGKADGPLCRPVHHARGNGAGLRDQRQMSRSRHMCGKARIETDARHHDAEAIRADQPHAVFLRGPLRCIRQRTRTVAEPGTDNDGARRPAAARLIDQACDGAGRRREDNEFRRKSQFCDAADGRDAVDLVITRVNKTEFALELAFTNIVEDGAANRAMARTGPDQRDGMRRKQIFQTIGRHRSFVPG